MADPVLKNSLTQDPRTVKLVHAERNRLFKLARDADVKMQDTLGSSGILDTFKKAKLEDPSQPFSIGDLASKFKVKYGITDNDLNLTKDQIEALPSDTEERRNKQKALLLKLDIEELAKEIAAKQQAGLWQQHILFASLLEDSNQVGIRIGGDEISPSDLAHLNTIKSKALKIFDEKNLPRKAILEIKYQQGKPFFSMSPKATPSDIHQVIDVLAASGHDKVSVDCKRAGDLPLYKMMIQESFMHIIEGGYDMTMQVNQPHFVAQPGSILNEHGEPYGNIKAFRKGKAFHEFGVAIAAAMPKGAAMAADQGARLGMTYENLPQKHKQMFLKMLGSRPNGNEHLKAMAGYFIRTGQIDKLLQFQNDVGQVLRGDMRVSVAQMIDEQVAKMNMKELNETLDKAFDSTAASPHRQNLAITPVSSSQAGVVVRIITAMTPVQVKNYAKHLAANQDMEHVNDRAGMVLTHSKGVDRQAFIETYLTEVQRKSCEKYGIKPGELPTVVPPVVAETADKRQEKYAEVQNDVEKAAADLMSGVNNYTKRTAVPNADVLDTTAKTCRAAVENLAQQRVDDIAAVHPTAGIDAAARTASVKAATDKFEENPTVAAYRNCRDAALGGEFAPNASLAPFVR